MALHEELEGLARLHAEGALSDEEYQRAKERLIAGEPDPAAGAPPPGVPPAQPPAPAQEVPAKRKGRRTGCLVVAVIGLAVVAGGVLLGWRFFESRVLPSITGTAQVLDEFGELADMSLLAGPPGPCYDLDVVSGRVTGWTEVSCDGPRDVETFFVADFRGETFPGDQYLADAAAHTCGEAFELYVGTSVDQSRYSVNWMVPSEATWTNGDRQAVCFVVSSNRSQLTGIVKGSAN